MSDQAMVPNLFLIVRVLLIGAVLLVTPRLNRKGLLFGAYVGEQFDGGEEARRLLRRWYAGCGMLMVLALVVGLGISAAGWPVAGNLTGTAVLLLSALGHYLGMYYRVRKVAPPAVERQAECAVATLEVDRPKGVTFAKLAIGLCLVSAIVTFVYGVVSYELLPDRLPLRFGLAGESTTFLDKSFVSVMLLPSMNLVFSPFLAVLALLTATAKRSLRGGSGGRSAEAQVAFRRAIANTLSGTALFTCLFLTFMSVQMIRLGLAEIQSIGAGFWVITATMLASLAGALIWIMSRYGQGGSKLEIGSEEAPLTNGIADNRRWVWGMFYVARDDPSMMVEKRFGFGYTLNLGNPKAAMLVGTFLTLILGLTAVALVGLIS